MSNLDDIEVGDFVQAEYTGGAKLRGARISGRVTKIWLGPTQIQLDNGWCFHPGDKVIQHEKKRVEQ